MSISNMTTLCYPEKDGCYLMLHRVKKKNDINHDKWLGVGGHFEDGESPEDCVLRETKEETGLTLLDPRLRGVITFVSGADNEYMFLFTATKWQGTQTLCDEGTLEWIPKEKVATLPIWEGDKIFFALLEEPDRAFFSLKLIYEGDRLTQAVLDGAPYPI